MSSDLTKFSAITWQSFVWNPLKRRETWVQEADSIQLWKRIFYSFRNGRMGKCHFHCVKGSDGITSGIAWTPDEEFIRKDELTLEQKQRKSVRIVRKDRMI